MTSTRPIDALLEVVCGRPTGHNNPPGFALANKLLDWLPAKQKRKSRGGVGRDSRNPDYRAGVCEFRAGHLEQDSGSGTGIGPAAGILQVRRPAGSLSRQEGVTMSIIVNSESEFDEVKQRIHSTLQSLEYCAKQRIHATLQSLEYCSPEMAEELVFEKLLWPYLSEISTAYDTLLALVEAMGAAEFSKWVEQYGSEGRSAQ